MLFTTMSKNYDIGDTINIRPETNVLLTFKNLPYKAPYAIAEFVDNAVQSYIDNKKRLKNSITGYRLKIDIVIEGKNIVIRDNAAGIPSSQLKRALTAGQKPIKGTGLSQYGMGMKTAGIWFSPYWDVTTSAIGETETRKIMFDDKKFEKSIDDIKIEKLKPTTRTRGFTIITLKNCHRRIGAKDISTLKKFLASMYRVFIRRNELILKYNGEILKYKQPPISISPPIAEFEKYLSGDITKKPASVKWVKKIDLVFDEKENMSVYGWIGRADDEVKGITGRTVNDGIAIFRRDRLILGGSPELNFRYRSKITGHEGGRVEQVMVGELFVSNVEATHTKDDLSWTPEQKFKFEKMIKDEISQKEFDLYEQCESWLKKLGKKMPVEKDTDEEIDKAPLEKVSPTIKIAFNAAYKKETKGQYDKSLSEPKKAKAKNSFRKTINLGTGSNSVQYKIAVNFVDTEAKDEYWYHVSYPQEQNLSVYDININISLNHKFTRAYIVPAGQLGQELLGKLCTWLAIAEVSAMKTGGNREKPARVRLKLNEILRILPPEY